NPNIKRYKPVTYLEVKLALKEFVLNYQHRTVLSDAILIEKAKMIVNGLGIPQDALQFSSEWLHKFKDHNGICQRKLEGEASSAVEAIIANALPLLKKLYSNYPSEKIYNMDKTGLFYRLKSNRTFAIKQLSGCKLMDARIIMSFKQYYHHFHMRWILRYVEAGGHAKNLRMNVLQAICYIIQVWDEVEEFFNIPEENIVYEVSKDDQIIEKLVYLLRMLIRMI
ncbi:hypothetical protein RhiirA4_514297, partial [Rhizophagus irregularis]